MTLPQNSLLHTLTTKVNSSSNEQIYILLDGGSSHSMVDKPTAKLLKAKVLNKVNLEIQTINGNKAIESQLVTFNLPAGNEIIKIKAYVYSHKIMEINSYKNRNMLKLWQNSGNEILEDVIKNSFSMNTKINLIIGQDNMWSIGLSQVIPHQNESLGLIKTKLGWSMAGNTANLDSTTWRQGDHIKINAIKVQNQDEIGEIEASLQRLFDRDAE